MPAFQKAHVLWSKECRLQPHFLGRQKGNKIFSRLKDLLLRQNACHFTMVSWQKCSVCKELKDEQDGSSRVVQVCDVTKGRRGAFKGKIKKTIT